MKKKYYILMLSVALLMGMGSCDYLDIVPDERTTDESTYETKAQVTAFLYSCYGFQPSNRDILSKGYHMMCAEETSYFRKEDFSTFNEGDYGPTKLHMTAETWAPVWNGIRQCYKFLSVVDNIKLSTISNEELTRYKAEANYMIAYYHFISLRAYGPTIIMDKMMEEDTPIEDFPERSSYDEVVSYIDKKLEEALPGLADEHSTDDYGRATKFTALALRSRMYLYAASPLFNGNSEMYSNFKSKKDGRHLISQEYSAAKWQKSADVTLDAIQKMEAHGFSLYNIAEAGSPSATKPGLSNAAQRAVRYCVMDAENSKETIWADTRKEDNYGVQRRSMPRQAKGHTADIQGCIVPTLQTVESFYTKNGLPMEYDNAFDYVGRYTIDELPNNYDGNNYELSSEDASFDRKTLKQHIDREPRFYAWIGFHNGFSEIAKYNDKEPSKDNAKKAIALHFRKNDPHGKGARTANYSVTGYNNKKLCHPAYTNGPVMYPLPVFRLSELYLNYAEALIEIGGDANLNTARNYIDRIRVRAGIPTVEDAWTNFSNSPNYHKSQDGMREIVRQERNIEFYLEGHKFFDIRRWKIAEKYLGIPVKGLNVDGATNEDFFKVAEVNLRRTFHKGQYLMPIKIEEINKNPQLVQNPYYN